MACPRERELILEGVPASTFVREPGAVPAIHVVYTGAPPAIAELTLEHDQVTVHVNNLEVLTFSVVNISVAAVVLLLDLLPDFTATLLDATLEEVRGVVLLDTGTVRLSDGPVDIGAATNPFWLIAEAVGRQLEEAADRTDVGLAQANLLTSATYFAELYGELFGIPRHLTETDGAYTARQLHELLRPRENNYAIADIIETDFPGVLVSQVDDELRNVFVVSKTPLRGYYLPGRQRNAAVMTVYVSTFPTAELVQAVQRAAAAGIAVFVLGSFALGDAEGYLFEPLVPALVGAPIPMQIGSGTIGIDAIDGT